MINIQFYKDESTLTIQANPNDLFAEIALNYLQKLNLNDEMVKFKFIYNSKQLSLYDGKTISELNMYNNCIVNVTTGDNPFINDFIRQPIPQSFHQNLQNLQLDDLNINFIFCGRRILIQGLSTTKFCEMAQKFFTKAGLREYTTTIFVLNDSSQIAQDDERTLSELKINNFATIEVFIEYPVIGAGYWMKKTINIKFIKVSKNCNEIVCKNQPLGLLKLCLLKEIAPKLDNEQLKKLPDLIRYIMEILLKDYIESGNNIQEEIKEVLYKMEGSNIINFSYYVDEIITSKQIDNILELLSKNDLKIINDIKYRLSKYNKYIKLFDSEFEKAKKESIFEFSIISLVIIEREDFETFEKEREKCPNRVEKILYHGTSIEPISCILTGLFKKSIDRCYQHGKGVYFTDFLDYCWYYGGEVSNRSNKNKIPKIKETFTMIACSIYYDKNGFKKVDDYKYTPKKNEINFAYADAEFETLIEPDKSKFFGTEYVIWDLNQICPFMSAKLERNEFCVIWRDNNFSSKPVYNNEFDKTFKKFLKERLDYIKQVAKYNIYPCETSEEALELIKRKKYNKIILISNVGTDLGGKIFVEKARKIIGNDVIALFLAYNISHLDWIKNYKNALFSNEPKFYEDYIECFYEVYNMKGKIQSLIDKMEKHYNVKFNFDEKFLDYPHFKENGKYSDLSF